MGNLDDSLPLTMLGGKMTLSSRLKPLLKTLLISGAFKPCENYVRWTSNIMGCYSDHFSNCGITDAIHASQYVYHNLSKVSQLKEVSTYDWLQFWFKTHLSDEPRMKDASLKKNDTHGDIPALPHADEVSVQWSQADEEAFLNVLDAPSTTSNLSSSIAITGDLEQQVYLDATICLVNGLKKLMLDADPKGIVDLSVPMSSTYTKLEEVGVDPTTLKHSIQELVVAAVEYDNSILTKKKVLSFAEGFDSHSAMVKAKTYELAILDLKISKLKEKRETSQKSLALDQSEAVKKKDELKLAKIDLQEAEDALSGEGIIFEKIFNEVEIRREKLRALSPLSPSS
ncbi:hypothetical protein ACFE04_013424 [Oxalis oulophora]